MKFSIGLDWACPTWGINWHRCYGYWNLNFWPFWLNIDYGEGFEPKNEK